MIDVRSVRAIARASWHLGSAEGCTQVYVWRAGTVAAGDKRMELVSMLRLSFSFASSQTKP